MHGKLFGSPTETQNMSALNITLYETILERGHFIHTMSRVGQISLPDSVYLHYTEAFIFEIMMFACIFAINVQEK